MEYHYWLNLYILYLLSGADDELWCERTDRSLPSDLNQNMNTAFTPSDISQPDLVTLAAPTILVTPLFLLISALIVTLRV